MKEGLGIYGSCYDGPILEYQLGNENTFRMLNWEMFWLKSREEQNKILITIIDDMRREING